MSRFLVVESPTGVRHDYSVTYGIARTGCGRVVPRVNGWFGPIDKDADCVRCISRRPPTAQEAK